MGMFDSLFGGGSPPQAPDPYGVATAQYGFNTRALNDTLNANRINQVNSLGGLSYTNNNGQWTQSQTSPYADQLFGLGRQALGRLNFGGIDTSGFTPITGNNQDAVNATQNAIMSRLNPQIDRSNQQLQSTLLNQGILPGSEAYKNAQLVQGQNVNDLRLQSDLAANTEQNQLFGQQLAANNQQFGQAATNQMMPYQQAGQLFGLGTGTMPQFNNFAQAAVAAPDYGNYAYQSYQGQLGAYNAQQAGNNALLGGLFQLGGDAAGFYTAK